MNERFPTPVPLGRIDGAAHLYPVRVYFEDTDAGGVAYHASYVRFLERGRTDFLHALGVSHRALAAGDSPIFFAVRRMTLDFARPARLEDDLVVRSAFGAIRGPRVFMDQEIRRDGQTLLSAALELACVTADGRVARPSKFLVNALAPYRGDVLKST